jgi:hypothetical protein
VGSRFNNWIYWTPRLQLHFIIAGHTLNSFLITVLSVYFFWFSDCSLISSLLQLSTTHCCESFMCPFLTRCGAQAEHILSQSLLLRPAVSRSVCLGIKNPSEAYDQILLLSERCGFIDVEHSLWREDGYVVYNCSWPSPSGLPFRRPLRLTGLWWRYSTPPPHGIEHILKVKVILRLTVSQSVSLGVEPLLGLMTRYLLLFDSYGPVFLGLSLWREGGSLFCMCCWPSPA